MEIRHPRRFAGTTAYGIIQEKYDAKWCFDMEDPNRGMLAAVFYGKERHPVSNSHYMQFYRTNDGKVMVTDAKWVEDFVFTALKEDDGSVIFSYDRHDFVQNKSGKFLDGGTSYVRSNCNPEDLVSFRLVEDKLEVINEI